MGFQFLKPALLSGALVAVLFSSGCANDDTSSTPQAPSSQNFDFAEMLVNYSDNILMPAYLDLQNSISELSAASDAFCAAPGMVSVFPDFVRTAWLDLMTVWQQVEMMRVGPLLEDDAALRHQIHPFNAPNISFSACAVDQNVAQQAQNSDFNIETRPLGGRGLWALEYLYFDDTLTQRCPSQIVETQGWNDKPEDERIQERCDFAEGALTDIQSAVDQLITVWSDDGEDYRSIFINPFNAEVQLKALSDALYFIEKETKDAKLGIPLAIKRPGCNQTACPDLLESPYSQSSRVQIQQNIVTFQTMMKGASGLGFDDLLDAVGAGYLVGEFDALIDQALAILSSEDEAFFSQLETLEQGGDASVCVNAQANPDTEGGPTACRLHGVLKQITDRLRMEFSTAIEIDLPDRVGGDGD